MTTILEDLARIIAEAKAQPGVSVELTDIAAAERILDYLGDIDTDADRELVAWHFRASRVYIEQLTAERDEAQIERDSWRRRAEAAELVVVGARAIEVALKVADQVAVASAEEQLRVALEDCEVPV